MVLYNSLWKFTKITVWTIIWSLKLCLCSMCGAKSACLASICGARSALLPSMCLLTLSFKVINTNYNFKKMLKGQSSFHWLVFLSRTIIPLSLQGLFFFFLLQYKLWDAWVPIRDEQWLLQESRSQGSPPVFWVSIPVSISRLWSQKSWFQSRFQDSRFQSLHSSLNIKTQISKVLIPVLISRLNYQKSRL